jgi:aminoglycoside phosphotransferase (APT) family kinase protein
LESKQAEGYDIPAVEAWIAANTEGLTPPFEWSRLEGGHSNLTYLLEDASGNKAVVRRPPLGKLLPKAHDMGREWSVISSLAPTGFPVPAAYGFCDDQDVTGATFYVMGFVEGRPLHNKEQAVEWVPEDKRVTMAHSFIDTLADLHSFDPDEIGLGGFAKKEDYIARQVNVWYRSWQASIEPAQLDDPRAHELKQFFLDNTPEQGTARVVHGDYGFHNCLIGEDSKVSAVIDWEISTLGDPLADLAYTLKTWPESEADLAKFPDAPTSAGGFPYQAELAQRYAERTGSDISKLDFYYAFNHWKLAAIVHGVYARYCAGQKSTAGIDMDLLLERIMGSLDWAVTSIERFEQKAKG